MSLLNSPYDAKDKRVVIPEYASYTSKHSAGGLVQERRTTKWTPTGGSNSYTINQNTAGQIVSFRIASDHLLDMETACLQYAVTPTAGATAMSVAVLDNGGLSPFRTAVVRVAGVPLESIENVGTVQNVVSYATMSGDYLKGTGFAVENQWRLVGADSTANGAPGIGATAAQAVLAASANSSGQKTWLSIPLSVFGITRTKSYFPARFASPVELEFTFDSLNNFVQCATAGQLTGSSITFSDFFLSVDQVVCNPSYYAALGSKISGGDGIAMLIPTIATQSVAIQAAAGVQTVQVSRGLSNLMSVWAVMQPTANINSLAAFSKSDFWLDTVLDAQLQVAGGKLIPEQPAVGYGELLQEMKKSFGTLGSVVGSHAFTPYNFVQGGAFPIAGSGTAAQTARAGIIGFNCEGVIQEAIDADNGVNTAATGSNIQLRVNFSSAPAASTLLACLHYGLRVKLQGGQLMKIE